MGRRPATGQQAAPDPGPEPTLDECAADIERERLFEIIRQLVLWENTTNETVLQQARDEIWQSWRYTCAENADHPRARELFDRYKLPAFHDPFAGGGALPLEAQRLGLEAYASDLNPVAVLINKAMIEIPPKFAGRPPVNPETRQRPDDSFKQGVARRAGPGRGRALLRPVDARRGGEAHRPPVPEDRDHGGDGAGAARPQATGGRKLTVIAWLWARTVKSPNPAFAQVDVPLASTFMLSTKPGKEAYVEPVIEGGGYRFTVKVGKPKDAEAAKNGTKLPANGPTFRCLMSGTPIPWRLHQGEGKAGRMGARLMAIVAEGERGRVYLAPTPEHGSSRADGAAGVEAGQPTLSGKCRVDVSNYGLTPLQRSLHSRQLVALTTFSDLVQEVRGKVRCDALAGEHA